MDARISSRAPRAGALLLAIALVLNACATTPPSLFGLPDLSPNDIVGDGLDKNADMPLQSSFPYIGLPHGGYEHVHHNQHL